MRKPKPEVGDNQDPPVTQTKIGSTANCEAPRCPACQLSKAHRKNPKSQRVQPRAEREMAMRREDLEPGERISMDQYQSRILGRLPNTFGKEPEGSKYVGGTIFVDHSSGYIFIHHQSSLKSGPTLQGKHAFERLAGQCNVQLKSFHADNHPFSSEEIREDIELQEQKITYSGVGAHFQNGVSERAIQTVTSWALCYMMHQLLHWPTAFQDDLWPFALDHAVNIWNHLPQTRDGLTPTELFTRTKCPRHNVILNSRVWGCPVYVLDPTLQDGKKLPKWTKKSHQGIYLGASPSHSTTVGGILNQETGHVSPQCHVVHDELFTSVQGEVTSDLFDEITWRKLLRLGYSRTIDPTDEEGDVIPFHDFYDAFSDSDDDSSSSESAVSSNTDSPSEISMSSSSSIPPLPASGSLVSDLEFHPVSPVSEGDEVREGERDETFDFVPVGPDDLPIEHPDPIREDDIKPPAQTRKHRRRRSPKPATRLRSG